MLFNVVEFVKVMFVVDLFVIFIDLENGDVVVVKVDGIFILYGKVVFMIFVIKVSKFDDDIMMVSIVFFILIKVEVFGLIEGVEVL